MTTAASVKVILRKNDSRGSKMVIDHLQRNETLSILESNRYSSECKKEWFDHDYASSTAAFLLPPLPLLWLAAELLALPFLSLGPLCGAA